MIAITADLLYLISPAPHAKAEIVEPVAASLNNRQAEADLDLNPLRLAHFLAQAAHECDGFKTLVEYASGKAYEGREDLGNTEPGDGVRYRGRGIFQLTGRANYKQFGRALKLDLVGIPMLAQEPDICVQVALLYWKAKKLNFYADQDDIKAITRRINGGYNGLESRRIYLQRAKRALGL
jgi:putative chitinase